ncbi:MAG TPA: hypothetical protein VLH75_18780 [Longimicrobiales bacterium]|nr:hypothetical protein [Longimicrobiales bacterium]
MGDSVMSVQDYSAATGRGVSALRGIPLPKQYQDVAFAVGFDWNSSGPDGMTVSTNLLGAAVGSAFDLIGSTQLKSFLTDNLTAGFAVPSGDAGAISGTVAVAVGGIRFGDAFAMFPTLGFEQTTADSTYVPSSVLSSGADQDTWSRPILSVAFLSPTMFKEVSRGFWFFSRICGWIPAQVGRRGCDTRRFPWL